MPVVITGNNTPTAGGITYGDGSTYANTAAGTSGQLLQSNGASAPTWTTISSSPTVVRSARTSNTILGTADASTLIAITSGTFTQTFTAAATLGSGWFCYIQNAGTGDITLDPNASETIDGLTSYIMYPNEVRLVQCNGTAFNTVVLSPFYRAFTASGTFTKPPGYSTFGGLAWSAGASGQRTNNASAESIGGGGGGCFPFSLLAQSLAATETVTIGAGGAARTTVVTGETGGNTSFGTFFTVYGATNAAGGSIGTTNRVQTSASNAFGFEAAASTTSTARSSFYGGTSYSATVSANVGGTIYGGGAGGTLNNLSALFGAGSSNNGGAGGAASSASNGTDGTAPGGGGGATQTGTSSGAGARGELRIWGIA